MRLLTLAGLLLAAAPALAQTPGSCTLGTARGDLATPDLFARVFNTGSLFFGNQTFSGEGYLVPRGAGHSSIFAAGLWVGGRVGGEVRTAGSRYDGFQFWPGPLDAGAVLPDPAGCAAYDRIWVASPADVAAYEAGATPAVDLREWPVGLGAPAVDAQGLPVPVATRGQRIDLPGGERPVFGGGGPTAFWVMNDVGNSHGANGSAPLGVEVRVTASAPATGTLALRQATVYRYTVVNRNALPIDSLHVGIFVDPDLGDFQDDFVGTDTTRGMAFAYNGVPTDLQYGIPPALGVDLLGGLWSSGYFESASVTSPTTDPNFPGQYYNRMKGLWNDGTPMYERGGGYGPQGGAPVTRYVYNGDPVTAQRWSERNTGGDPPANFPNDRRLTLAAPATTLAPGESRTVDVAIVFAQGTDYLNSVTALRAASDRIQTAYDAGTLFGGTLAPGTAAAPTLVAPAEGVRIDGTDVTFSWQPVAGASGYVLETSDEAAFSVVRVTLAAGTTATLPAAAFAANQTEPFFWRVRTVRDGLDGPPSAARSFLSYRYVAGPLLLASGALAIVETTAPGGAPACDGPADPDEGCAETGGDLVASSLNSTGDYSVFASSSTAIGAFAPNDFEVRFTAAGSVAVAGVNTRRLFRVPFEVWDVGPVTPGQPNDPSDDRQLVAGMQNNPSNLCAFAYAPSSQSGPQTPFLRAHYPVGGDYAAYAALAGPLVASSPTGCPSGAAVAAAVARIDFPRGIPVTSVVLEQASTRTVAELAGATIRFYSVDRVVASETPAGAEPELALGAPFPNPASGSVVIPYTVATAGLVRLRLVDVLGRTVAVLAEGTLAAGGHEARLDARGLAAGTYALVLDGGTARSVRTLTVVR